MDLNLQKEGTKYFSCLLLPPHPTHEIANFQVEPDNRVKKLKKLSG